MSERAQALAARFERVNNELIVVVERLAASASPVFVLVPAPRDSPT
jgi:hypothetical protein